MTRQPPLPEGDWKDDLDLNDLSLEQLAQVVPLKHPPAEALTLEDFHALLNAGDLIEERSPDVRALGPSVETHEDALFNHGDELMKAIRDSVYLRGLLDGALYGVAVEKPLSEEHAENQRLWRDNAYYALDHRDWEALKQPS